MSREIKFRAWDNKKKKWLADSGLNVLAVTFDGTEISCHDDSCESPITYLEDVELCQYSGLKDKKGFEVYDGDFVKDPVGNIGKFFWGDWGWLIEFTSETIDPDGLSEWAEVIGNIYEHPHLLK